MNPLTRISFEVPGEPVAKERPRTNMATGVVYTPDKTKNYEETVKWCYQMAAHGARFPDNEPLSMLVVAYRPIPKSASAKKKSLMRAGAERPITKPDWDNVGKIVSDALNGIAYRDDSQIVDARVVKRYSDNPMVKVSVWLTNDIDTSRWVNG
jgi:Holliday junction resolvase RusA-like endonuclease